MADGTTVVETRYRTRYRGRGCGAGCGLFVFVLTVGLVLTLFDTAVGVGLSVRVPLTQSNLTVAGAVGPKEKVVSALPDYTQGRLAGNQNFFNNSTTMTIWVAEAAGMIVLGNQEGAPVIDLHLVAR